MVNEYIQQICGSLYSAKDFRTWSATLSVFDGLKELGLPESSKKREKNCLKAIDTAADSLNNTRAVCRKYYVHPKVLSAYMDGSILDFFEKAEEYAENIEEYKLQPSEKALQELLSLYKPEDLLNQPGMEQNQEV